MDPQLNCQMEIRCELALKKEPERLRLVMFFLSENGKQAAISPMSHESQMEWHVETNYMESNQMPPKELSQQASPGRMTAGQID
jgi:hypothetical protein